MTSSDGMPRRRLLEEQYFRKQEQELIDKLRRRAAAEAARERLASDTGLADGEILEDLLALGYTPDTVMLLHLAPLVQVAWADGSVSDRERELIVAASRTRGVAEGSTAARQLDAWLAERPTDAMFEKTLRAVIAMLEARPAREREQTGSDLLSYCAAVAEVSGGILGFGKVSPEERRTLAQITHELERDHRPAIARAIELFASV